MTSGWRRRRVKVKEKITEEWEGGVRARKEEQKQKGQNVCVE